MVLDVLRAAARRWYIVLAGLLLTAGLTWTAYQASPPDYTARGLILLLPGENALGEGGNPFLSLSGLEQPASIVVAYFASTAAQTEVEAVSPTADFTVELDGTTRGPVIAVDVTDKTPDATLETLGFLTTRVPEELQRLQEEVGAPSSSIIGSMPIVMDQQAETDNSGTIRLTIAALVVGLVITGIATFAIDGLALRRRARRGYEEAIEPDEDLESVESDTAPVAADQKARYVRKPRVKPTREATAESASDVGTESDTSDGPDREDTDDGVTAGRTAEHGVGPGS